MGALLHRNPNSHPPEIIRTAGCYLYDRAGRDYLDASAAAGAAILGYDYHDWVVRASPHSASVTTEMAEQLAAELIQDFGDPKAGVFFLSTGAEAVEAACKLAAFYQTKKHGGADWTILSRQRSYHGNTLWALGLSDAAARRQPYLEILPWPRPYLWPIPIYADDDAHLFEVVKEHGWSGYWTQNTYNLRLAADVGRVQSRQVAGVLVETISGTMAGIVPPPPEYMTALRAQCDREGWLVIADEILCGNHRAGMGTFVVNGYPNCRADIVVVGKSLAAGWWPLSAVVVSGEVRKVIEYAGQLPHTSTFMNHAAACAAGVVARDRQLHHITRYDWLLQKELGKIARSWGLLLRGSGLLWGLEIVNPKTQRPFPTQKHMAYRVQKTCLEVGLIIYAARGCRGGYEGDQLVIMPPYNISENDIAELIRRLTLGLQRTFESRHN